MLQQKFVCVVLSIFMGSFTFGAQKANFASEDLLRFSAMEAASQSKRYEMYRRPNPPSFKRLRQPENPIYFPQPEQKQQFRIQTNRNHDDTLLTPFVNKNRRFEQPSKTIDVIGENSLINDIHRSVDEAANHNQGKVYQNEDRIEFQIHGQNGPNSYRFGHDTGSGLNRQFRYEERDNAGFVKGRYGFFDQYGKLHVVNYSSDPKLGFHAEGDGVPVYPH